MKILVFNQYFYPEVASSAQILTELCEDLARAGHSVTVICGMPSYRRREEMTVTELETRKVKELPSGSAVGRAISFLLSLSPSWLLEGEKVLGINILRVCTYAPILSTSKWRYIQRMLQYISYFLFSLPIAFLCPKANVVLYLSTPPLLNGITANLIKLFKGTPNIFNIQDLYPDIAINLGVIKEGVLTKPLYLIEKFLYEGAQYIIPIGFLMERALLEKKVPPDKIRIIPNWMDTEQIRPLGKNNSFAKEHRLLDKFVVMYSGNIGLSQGLENVLRAAAKLKDINDLLFLFIGGGENLQRLKMMAEELELDNVRFLPYQPKSRLSESLSSAEVHLLTLKRGLSKFSVPSKIYGITASARPVIAAVDSEGEIAEMVRKAACGMVVEPENPQALAEAIRSLYNDREKLDLMGMNGRNYLEQKSTRKICVTKYIELFDKVANTNR